MPNPTVGFQLELWGGLLYLLNKVFFLFAELSGEAWKRRWRIVSWIVYLAGLPFIVVLFSLKHRWIAASIEAGGAPAMLIGLAIALRGKGQEPRWLDWIARIAIVVGTGYSIYDFGGINTVEQLLEIGVVAGFLIGTYLLAKQRPGGYFWFMIMNTSCSALMYLDERYIMTGQQILSFIAIGAAMFIERRNRRSIT